MGSFLTQQLRLGTFYTLVIVVQFKENKQHNNINWYFVWVNVFSLPSHSTSSKPSWLGFMGRVNPHIQILNQGLTFCTRSVYGQKRESCREVIVISKWLEIIVSRDVKWATQPVSARPSPPVNGIAHYAWLVPWVVLGRGMWHDWPVLARHPTGRPVHNDRPSRHSPPGLHALPLF